MSLPLSPAGGFTGHCDCSIKPASPLPHGVCHILHACMQHASRLSSASILPHSFGILLLACCHEGVPRAAVTCRLASQAMAAALAASSGSLAPQSAGLPPVGQPLQQPASSAQPAAPAPVVTTAPPAPAVVSAAEAPATEPKLESTPEPEQHVKPEPEPAKGEPGGWSGWSGWE